MKINHFLALFFIFAITVATCCTSCGDKKKKSYDEVTMSGLTQKTENLQTNIKAFANKGTLIGQMYGTLSGIGWNRWECDSDRCDMESICGYHPAANGYELAGIESGKKQNIDGVPFKAIREDVLKNFRRGGLLIMNWTAPNYNGNEICWKSTPSKSPNTSTHCKMATASRLLSSSTSYPLTARHGIVNWARTNTSTFIKRCKTS